MSDSEDLVSKDAGTRKRAHAARVERVESFRAAAPTRRVEDNPERDVKAVIDQRFVRKTITKPKSKTKRVYVVYIDNSGSNRAIAEKLRQSAGYMLAVLKTLDPEAEIVIIYASDHTDGNGLYQPVDFVSPDEEGDKILTSTTSKVFGVSGHDEAEAHECWLKHACEIDFNNADERHLILVSDVVGHGMGMREDSGCPLQVKWEKSLEKVRKTFTSFTVVGSGDIPAYGDLQKQFLAPERVPFDLIDLSGIQEQELRLGIVANAVLFLIARGRGKQSVELFFSALYEKWLKEPIFGGSTDKMAREAIRRFGKYLEYSPGEIETLMRKVLIED